MWPFKKTYTAPATPADVTDTHLILTISNGGEVNACLLPRRSSGLSDEDSVGGDVAKLLWAMSEKMLHPTYVDAVETSTLSSYVKKKIIASLRKGEEDRDVVAPNDVFPTIASFGK